MHTSKNSQDNNQEDKRTRMEKPKSGTFAQSRRQLKTMLKSNRPAKGGK